jgi:hypothetical protein
LRLLRVARVASWLLALGAGRVAEASPIDDPHIGGIGFAGPTTDDLSALYWNPAALGLGTGARAMYALFDHKGTLDVERAPIDPTTGRPVPEGSGGRSFPRASGTSGGLRSPWGPGSFAALALPLGSRITVALGWFYPFVHRQRFEPIAGAPAETASPVRYHAVSTNLSTMAITGGISALLGAGVRVGFSPALQVSTGSLIIDEDSGVPSGSAGALRLCGGSPCGAEDPSAAARYVISAGRSVSFTLGASVHINRPLWSAGVSWTSAPFGTRDGIEIEGESTRIDPPDRLAPGSGPCSGGGTPCLSSRLVFHLPMLATAGVDRHLTARWDVGVQARWLDLSSYDGVQIRVAGPAGGALRGAGLPEELQLHRGLQDVLDLRVRTVVRIGDRYELAASLRGETASVRDDAISAGAIGGRLVEPALAVKARLSTHVVITAGYALSLMPWVNANPSSYDPGANAACEASGGDLEAEPCQKRQRGLAAPTAAGRYRATAHAFGLSLAVAF